MTLLLSNIGFLTGLGLLCALVARGVHAWWNWSVGYRHRTMVWQASLRRFHETVLEKEHSREECHEHSIAWHGYRRFVVAQLIPAASQTASIYLVPEDGRPLPNFQPGQYLTLRIQLPGVTKPLIRCYSLSDRPREDHYRLTVKAAGQASEFLYRELRVGNVLDVQAPRGDFVLDQQDPRAVVFVAAGIGITPVFSMLSTILQEHSARPVVLFYGVRNSTEHAFNEQLTALARQHKLFQYVPCYSQPLPTDRLGYDYVAGQRIDIDLLRKIMPHAAFPIYLCGPGSFMEAMVGGLKSWGVAESDIHYEAFGPATVKSLQSASTASPASSHHVRVTFRKSGQTTQWEQQTTSILEHGEEHDLSLPSGCRSGNCGMCAIKLLAGKVRYLRKPSAEIPGGYCLSCVAVPENNDLILDA